MYIFFGCELRTPCCGQPKVSMTPSPTCMFECHFLDTVSSLLMHLIFCVCHMNNKPGKLLVFLLLLLLNNTLLRSPDGISSCIMYPFFLSNALRCHPLGSCSSSLYKVNLLFVYLTYRIFYRHFINNLQVYIYDKTK